METMLEKSQKNGKPNGAFVPAKAGKNASHIDMKAEAAGSSPGNYALGKGSQRGLSQRAI